MRKAIDQDTLEALISTGAMGEFRVVRHHGAWEPGSSRREPVRAWASLPAVGRFAESQGIRSLTVEF